MFSRNFALSCPVTAVILGLLGAAPGPSPAADYYWTGLDGTWSDTANWSPSGPPNATFGVLNDRAFLEFSDGITRVINGVGSAYYIYTGNTGGGSVTWNIGAGSNFSTSGCGVQVGAGTTVNLFGGELTWDMPGSFDLAADATVNQTGGSIFGSGSLSIAGLWNLGNDGTVGTTSSTIQNVGTINQTGGHIFAPGNFANAGEFNLSAGQIHGHIFNSGEFNLLGHGSYVFDGMHNIGTLNATGTAYFDYLTGLELMDGTVLNLHGTADTLVFYDPATEADAYLGGLTYQLTGGGYLMPIPEPSSAALAGLGAILLAALARRRCRPT